jgi:hypothetical protein
LIPRKIVRIALVAAVALASVVIAGPAPSASAAVVPSTIQYFTRSINGTANQVVRGTVMCPGGYRMVSSGAGGMLIRTVFPVGGFTGAQAIGFASTNETLLTVKIGCAPASQFADTITKTITLAPTHLQLVQGIVGCPSGTRAFGGGAFWRDLNGALTTRGGPLYANSVTPFGNAWIFSAHRGVSTDKLVMNVQCAPLQGSFIAASEVVMPDLGLHSVQASCPAGYTMLSGGFKPTNADGSLRFISNRWSFPTNGQWFAQAYATPGQGPGGRLTSYVQCIPNV